MNQSLKFTSILTLFLLNSLFQQGLSQTWTDPINISPDIAGLDNQPDLCIDKNGTLHCVFTHKLDNNWRKIYYSKSMDDGATWTSPEDISFNPDTSLMNPHIVADTNNKLYVAWDYNTGDPYQTMIYILKHNGESWENPVNITPDEPESHGNMLVIDNNNRLYCFWGKGGYHSNTYYKYLENDIWSETICPYPGNHYWAFTDFAIDDFNNIHCIGMFHEEGQSHDEDRIIYFKYEYDSYWSEKTFLSEKTSWLYGNEIDVDSQNHPHIAYRKKTPGTGPGYDSTMYRFFNGGYWSTPELVVNDPGHQRIVIDPYNMVHIFDKEKMEVGNKIVHYKKVNNIWEGYLTDSSFLNISNPDILELNNVLYLTYYKCFSDMDCKIRFMKNILPVGLNESDSFVDELNIYPNPFTTQTTIEFEITEEKEIDISVFNLVGQHLITIYKGNTQPGRYQHIWNGKDKNGKEPNNGLYLVRLQWGRNFVTKPVEYIK